MDDEMMNCQNNISIELLSSTDAPCGSVTGMLEIVSVANLSYSLDDQSYTTNTVFENLKPGVYTVFAQDAEGCKEEEDFQIFSNTSLVSDVLPIMEVTCALSGCHVSGAQLPDFTQKENIRLAAPGIKSNISNNSMPPSNTTGPDLSDADKETILCWINDGAKDN